jgi:hypothetical protein
MTFAGNDIEKELWAHRTIREVTSKDEGHVFVEAYCSVLLLCCLAVYVSIGSEGKERFSTDSSLGI